MIPPMQSGSGSTPAGSHSPGSFQTTHWSVILVAAREDSPDSLEALETLCQTYWRPLNVFARRSGYSESDAEDLTQDFFAHLIRSELVKKVELNGGKFRSFLLTCFKNLLCSKWEQAQTQKRGGKNRFLPIDGCRTDPEDSASTPDEAFDKAWALTVLQEALNLLVGEYAAAGRKAIFDELRQFLTGEKVPVTYSMVAERLGTTEGAVKMMVRRMRARYRQCLHAVLLRTVAREDQVDEEFRHLIQAL